MPWRGPFPQHSLCPYPTAQADGSASTIVHIYKPKATESWSWAKLSPNCEPKQTFLDRFIFLKYFL